MTNAIKFHLSSIERTLPQLRDRGIRRIIFVTPDSLYVQAARFKDMARLAQKNYEIEMKWLGDIFRDFISAAGLLRTDSGMGTTAKNAVLLIQDDRVVGIDVMEDHSQLSVRSCSSDAAEAALRLIREFEMRALLPI